MVHTDDRERKWRETRKGKSVTGTDQGQRNTKGEYVGDIAGVSVVRVFERALWSGKRHLLRARFMGHRAALLALPCVPAYKRPHSRK